MGLIGKILGMSGAARNVGQAVTDVAEVFVGNRADRDQNAHEAFNSVVDQFGEEFAHVGGSRFDSFVNGLNRMPRPLLALSTFALFGYAMAAPAGFSVRMQSLALVPEPLWWLLGAVVSFYFGAREMHYRRGATLVRAAPFATLAQPEPAKIAPARFAPVEATALTPRPHPAPTPPTAARVTARAADPDFNAAIEEWQRING